VASFDDTTPVTAATLNPSENKQVKRDATEPAQQQAAAGLELTQPEVIHKS